MSLQVSPVLVWFLIEQKANMKCPFNEEFDNETIYNIRVKGINKQGLGTPEYRHDQMGSCVSGSW